MSTTGDAYFKGVVHTDSASDAYKTSIAIGDPSYVGCSVALFAQPNSPQFPGEATYGYVSFYNSPSDDTNPLNNNTWYYNAVLNISAVQTDSNYSASTLTVKLFEDTPANGTEFMSISSSSFTVNGYNVMRFRGNLYSQPSTDNRYGDIYYSMTGRKLYMYTSDGWKGVGIA